MVSRGAGTSGGTPFIPQGSYSTGVYNPYAGQVAYRRCPVCREQMARRNYQKRSGVIIDQCHEHGTWLDANELEQIAGYVLSGRAGRDEDSEAERQARREKDAADAAVRRITLSSAQERRGRVFGTGSEDGLGVGSLVDLLSALLD